MPSIDVKVSSQKEKFQHHHRFLRSFATAHWIALYVLQIENYIFQTSVDEYQIKFSRDSFEMDCTGDWNWSGIIFLSKTVRIVFRYLELFELNLSGQFQ